MGLGSLILGIFSFLLLIAGALFFWVPFLGTMLSFLSPILAIAGVILGGVAMSRAKQGMGENEGLATAGLVINIIAFVPAMLVALTCGLCNTLCTGMFMTPPDPNHQSVPWDRDGGPGSNPLEDLLRPPDASVAAPTLTPPPTATEPMQRQGDDTPLPPPPLPAGPQGATPPPAEATTAAAPTTEPAPAEPAAAEPAAAEPAAEPTPPSTSGRRRRTRD